MPTANSYSGQSITGLFPIFVAKGKGKTSWKVGYIDRNGTTRIEPSFDDGTRFHGGLAAVQIKGKWGFINSAGTVVINPRFSTPGYFDAGVAAVSTNSGPGVVDLEDKLNPLSEFEQIMPFSEGLACFTQKAKTRKSFYGYIDNHCRIVVPPQFEGATSFSEGLAAVKQGGLWGYIRPSGDFQIEPRFSTSRDESGQELFAGGSFSPNGLAPVPVGGKVGFVDRTGSLAFTVDFEAAFPFHESRAMVYRKQLFGFIDSLGNTIVKPRFSLAHPFSSGWAPVEVTDTRKRNLWGFIDEFGDWIIPPKFLYSLDISDGLCLVETEKTLAYIDKSGKTVWEGPFVEYRRSGL